MILRFIAHNLILIKKYNYRGNALKNSIIYHIDGSRLNMGLADRFRQILGVYALAKKENKIFKLKMTAPCDIEDYLEPNLYDWKIDKKFLSFNILKVRFFYIGYFNKKYAAKLIANSSKSIYVYSSAHHTWITDFGYTHKELFNELFRPVKSIYQIIDNYLYDYHCWDTLHFRFVGLLDDFKKKNTNILTQTAKEELLQKCVNFVLDYINDLKKYVLICSDSITFQNLIKDMPQVITVPGTAKHFDYTGKLKDSNYQKEFLDFFLISKSDRIFSVSTKEMYKSDFPVLAASINDIPFSRVEI